MSSLSLLELLMFVSSCALTTEEWGVRNPSVLYEVHGVPGERLGGSFEVLGDVDGDGIGDFVVSGLGGAQVVFHGPGSATIVSGRTGERLVRIAGDATLGSAMSLDDAFGMHLHSVGDVDGDGARDFAVTAIGGDWDAQDLVYAYSGRSGKELWRAPSDRVRLGGKLLGLGDLDEDGAEELGLVDMLTGSMCVFAGRNGRLLFEVRETSDRVADVQNTKGPQPRLLVLSLLGKRPHVSAEFILRTLSGDSTVDSCGWKPAAGRVKGAQLVRDLDGDGIEDGLFLTVVEGRAANGERDEADCRLTAVSSRSGVELYSVLLHTGSRDDVVDFVPSDDASGAVEPLVAVLIRQAGFSRRRPEEIQFHSLMTGGFRGATGWNHEIRFCPGEGRVGWVGDLDGDGLEELAIGETSWSEPSEAELPRGRVLVLSFRSSEQGSSGAPVTPR